MDHRRGAERRMKRTVEIVRRPLIVSDWNPIIRTHREEFADAFAWADENPIAWKIVTTTRSHAFGRLATVYGPSSTASPEHVAMRVSILHEFAVVKSEAESLWTWAARFTLEHFGQKKLSGGFFQQHARWTDGKEYARNCATLDFTLWTRDAVVDRFFGWATDARGRGAAFYENTTRITIDGEDVRTLENMENSP
jgi:hypothetical protein